METCLHQSLYWSFLESAGTCGREDKPISILSPLPGLLGTYRQLQGFIEEPIALAVQVGIGASCFGHTDPGKAGLL